MKRHGGRQADQGVVLDDYYHMTSALGTLYSEGHIIIEFLIKVGKSKEDLDVLY